MSISICAGLRLVGLWLFQEDDMVAREKAIFIRKEQLAQPLLLLKGEHSNSYGKLISVVC